VHAAHAVVAQHGQGLMAGQLIERLRDQLHGDVGKLHACRSNAGDVQLPALTNIEQNGLEPLCSAFSDPALQAERRDVFNQSDGTVAQRSIKMRTQTVLGSCASAEPRCPMGIASGRPTRWCG
jgi:hypothetical protein